MVEEWPRGRPLPARTVPDPAHCISYRVPISSFQSRSEYLAPVLPHEPSGGPSGEVTFDPVDRIRAVTLLFRDLQSA